MTTSARSLPTVADYGVSPMKTDTPLAEAVLPERAPQQLHKLLEHWNALSQTRPPREPDFPFDDLVKAHPGLILLKPEWDKKGNLDLRYIRVGPEHNRRNQTEIEGELCSQMLYPHQFDRFVEVYGEVMESGRPHYWEIANTVFGTPPQEYVRLLLPLYDDEGRFAAFLGDCVWQDPDDPTEMPPDIANRLT